MDQPPRKSNFCSSGQERGPNLAAYGAWIAGRSALNQSLGMAVLVLALPLCAILAWEYLNHNAALVLLIFAFLGISTLYLQKAFVSQQTQKRLRAEQKCRQSEQRLNSLFNHMNSGAIILEARANGQDFTIREINSAALSSENLDRRDVIGKSVCDVFRGIREFGLFDLLYRVWRTGVAEYQPARYYREDRRRSWKQNSVYRLPTCEIVVIFNDISENRRAEESLKRSEETFAKVFKANPAAMAITRHLTGRIVDINPAFETLTGYRREELIDSSITNLGQLIDEPSRIAILEILKTCPTVAGREVRLKTRDGKILSTRYFAESVQLATESCLLSIIVDETQTQKAEEDRRLLEKQLYESQKLEAIGTLAGGIAHDFNNILGAVIGYAEIAACQRDPQKIRRYTDQILAAGLRAKDLVAQILTISRHSEHNRKPMDLRIIVKETLKMIRSIIPTNVEIHTCFENIPFTISGDPTHMHQVLMNVCANAAHAMGEAGGVLTVRLCTEELTLPAAGDLQLIPGAYVKLSISDTGCGIDPSIMDKIFDPFFTTKQIGKGTGLGLSVVYGIVKQHDGCIRASSTLHEGTTFSIYLPHLQCASASRIAATSAKTMIPGGTEHILFVDDERPLVDLAQRNLSALGYTVTACCDSREALRLFQADPDKFDLIITDMTMPKISGSDLSRQVTNVRPDQPIILCTGYSDFIDPEKAATMGIKDFILKPFSREILAGAIRKVLDTKTAHSGCRAQRQG